MKAAGLDVEVVDLERERVLGARGVQTVRGVDVAAAGAEPDIDVKAAARTVRGDVVAVGARPAPASELPRQHGATVTLDPARGGFAVIVDERFVAAVDVLACGDVIGYGGPDAARTSGEQAGRALAEQLESAP